MKNLFTFFTAIMLSSLSFAQLQNGNFETWNTTTIETATYWDCTSAINFASSELITPLMKTTDAYGGSAFALKMITMAGTTKNFVGINNGYWNNTLSKFTSGFAYSKQIDTLEGWYKYAPKSSGTGRVSIELRSAGVSLGQFSATLNANSSYTKFQIPFDLSQTPDTAVIMINTCQTPLNLSDTGTILIIDAIKFKSESSAGIQMIPAEANMSISPNPTTGEFSILYITKNAGKAVYSLIDESGKTLISELLGGFKTTVNITGFPKGLYFVKINDGDIILSKKLILQ